MANNNKSNYKRLINAGIPEKCDICGISKWNGEPIKLQFIIKMEIDIIMK